MSSEFMAVTADMVRQLGSANAALVWARVQFVCQVAGPGRVEDSSGRWWAVSVERLSDEVGLSLKAVRRALDGLLEAGHLESTFADEFSRDRTKAYRATGTVLPAHAHLPSGANASDQKGKCIRPEGQIHLPSGANAPYVEEVKNSSSVEADREDVLQLCETLRDCMVANGCRTPAISRAWMTAARLLLDTDGRPLAEALAVLEWSQQDSFWRANIQSLPKFRKQYDQLRLRMEDSGVRPPATATSVADWLRNCWQEHNTKEVAERSGLTFQPPDPPNDVDDLRAFNFQSRRAWIENNHDEIIRRVLLKEEKQTR